MDMEMMEIGETLSSGDGGYWLKCLELMASVKQGWMKSVKGDGHIKKISQVQDTPNDAESRATEDAFVMIEKIQDKEFGYPEEILITKSDLEEKIVRDVDVADTALTSVCMSHSGRMLCADSGSLLSEEYPLTAPGDYEYPLTAPKMKITLDDQYLVLSEIVRDVELADAAFTSVSHSGSVRSYKSSEYQRHSSTISTMKITFDDQYLVLSEIVRDFDTSVSMSHSGRMLTATSGSVCSYKSPLTMPGKWTEYQGHSSTKMKYLVTVSEDACVMIRKIQNNEGRGLKEFGYAEQILITKSDLEEKNSMMAELETRVDELKVENEYQLRLKDMTYKEKIKELTEKFIQEVESLKNQEKESAKHEKELSEFLEEHAKELQELESASDQKLMLEYEKSQEIQAKYQKIKTEKDQQSAKHEKELSDFLEEHAKELQDLESANKQKLMLERERFKEMQEKMQEMQEKTQELQEYCERQLQEMEETRETRERALEELTEYYETRIQEMTTELEQAHEESRQQNQEYKENKKQIEEDADTQIHDIKNKYERKLRTEKQDNQKLRGENGIMLKKFKSLQCDVEDHKEEIKKYQQETTKLNNVIRNLEIDITGLKKEIQERDETIQERDETIQDLMNLYDIEGALVSIEGGLEDNVFREDHLEPVALRNASYYMHIAGHLGISSLNCTIEAHWIEDSFFGELDDDVVTDVTDVNAADVDKKVDSGVDGRLTPDLWAVTCDPGTHHQQKRKTVGRHSNGFRDSAKCSTSPQLESHGHGFSLRCQGRYDEANELPNCLNSNGFRDSAKCSTSPQLESHGHGFSLRCQGRYDEANELPNCLNRRNESDSHTPSLDVKHHKIGFQVCMHLPREDDKKCIIITEEGESRSQ